jgi:uncharacterized protein (TIGR03382 family)
MRSNRWMRFRGSAALAGSLLLATATAHAVVPRQAARIPADELTALPSAGITKPLRKTADIRWGAVPSAAWSTFTAAAGGTWRAAYDRATGVPTRIWGSGISVPGANASGQIAEQFARSFLADHLALVAPGVALADFELASNHSDGEIRSIGFVQKLGGRRVVGGQISFRFKRDRLVAIGSEALPDVKVSVPRARLSRSALRGRATSALRSELALPGAPVSEPDDEIVLPLVADDAVLGYRVARPVTIDGGAEGRYLGYADVATGAILAVRQLNTYASGVVRYHTVDRHPARARIDRPAPRTHVMVAGTPQTTAPDGTVTWSPDTGLSITTAVVGDLVAIVNKATADGPLAVAQIMLQPGGQAVWDASAAELEDAQVNVFIDTNTVKDFVFRNLDPNMPKLGEQMTANVNIAQECNAFFDGKAINFFQSSMKCQNTGLLQDVVFHEFGHALHSAEIIEGVGKFDGAMSEGAADFLAASITNDSGMGRGFFYTDKPLRELDPENMEFRWPEDVQEIHHTGLIFGGTFWDLRKAMIAAYGETEGIRKTQKLYVGTLRRSIDIPSSLIEALVEDDDDGNLENGTPNECMIRDAYGRHGVRTASGQMIAPGALAEKAQSTLVRIDVTGLTTRCTTDEIEDVTVDWKPSGMTPFAGSAVAHIAGPSSYWVQLPLAQDDKVLYRAKVKFKDGSILTLADNLADPFYELYQGETVPLYCTSFEDGDPFAEGWTTGTSTGVESPWAWGEAMGGSTDPKVAYSGTKFLAQELGGDYAPGITTWVKMPPIDVGRWTDVHLQYRRWLAVEDSHFDQARVTVNDKKAWINDTANTGDNSALHHIDREWRFHDVPISGYVPGNVFSVGWDLHADEGLHLGGWQLDDVCIVANIHSICGDGVKSRTEACDDGVANADKPNMCRSYCLRPACGDQIVDSMEECDHGEGDATCSSSCKAIELPTLGGCCSASGGGTASFAMSALVGGLVLRRRRRTR